MDNKGKLIVLEGLDGSGKSTQFAILEKCLKPDFPDLRSISFPDYSDDSSALVRMYLSGEFSKNPADVNAYAASVFYAADRYASFMRFWKDDYMNGAVVLSARYTTSNCIYQMAKLPCEEWDGYLSWLTELEYVKLGLPVPDAVIFLDMPIAASQKLLDKRYGGDEMKKDIHESDVEFLQICREAALFAASRQGWRVTDCSENCEPLPVETVTGKIMAELGAVLKAQPDVL